MPAGRLRGGLPHTAAPFPSVALHFAHPTAPRGPRFTSASQFTPAPRPASSTHLGAAGEGAHEADHRQAGLGARVDKANHLHRGHALNHHLGQDVLRARRRGSGGVKVCMYHYMCQRRWGGGVCRQCQGRNLAELGSACAGRAAGGREGVPLGPARAAFHTHAHEGGASRCNLLQPQPSSHCCTCTPLPSSAPHALPQSPRPPGPAPKSRPAPLPAPPARRARQRRCPSRSAPPARR